MNIAHRLSTLRNSFSGTPWCIHECLYIYPLYTWVWSYQLRITFPYAPEIETMSLWILATILVRTSLHSSLLSSFKCVHVWVKHENLSPLIRNRDMCCSSFFFLYSLTHWLTFATGRHFLRVKKKSIPSLEPYSLDWTTGKRYKYNMVTLLLSLFNLRHSSFENPNFKNRQLHQHSKATSLTVTKQIF